MSYLTHLECSKCGKRFETDKLQTVCDACGKPLFARYDIEGVEDAVSREELVGREASMWKYWELLPVKDRGNVVTMGEGWTPLTSVRRLGEAVGIRDLNIKDEGVIATGTFKARGLSMAVSKAKELGVKRLALPSAGNAAGAMTAYGARAGMESYVFMPVDAPMVNKVECQIVGAKVVLVRGLISDCGKLVSAGTEEMGWFPLSTLKEPYRVEGKKTMGIEVAEQMDWELPDVIIYPTGGGTGIIGMWKAFDELEWLGWIGSERPRMVSIQAEGCAPIAKAYAEGREESTFWEGAETIAAGLRVPHALGDFLILRAVRESGGLALAVSDEEILEAVRLMARSEGLFACPEGAATLAALTRMVDDGKVDRDERVVLFNTGTGLKYTDLFEVDAPVFDKDERIDYRSL
ncbi:MAG: threonine synthase [Candidatus Bathyarchaeota archaeon]|nr:MAG: threonine synthase [Candidatus Bathyarchaeota archaeon]